MGAEVYQILMECVVCKKEGVAKVEIERQSGEITLCESCLDDFENGDLEEVTLLLANGD